MAQKSDPPATRGPLLSGEAENRHTNPRLLNEASEMVALSTLGNTKNLIITGAEVKGPLDIESLKVAVRSTVEDFPHLGCSIGEVKRRGRFYLTWEPRPDLEFPVKEWTVSDWDPSTHVIDAFLRTVEPSIEREWNIFEELPGEFHVVSFSDVHHVVAPVIHHLAADAAVASEFGKFVALKYREIKTGDTPESSPQTQSLSTSKKKKVEPKRRNWLDSLKSTITAARTLTQSPVLPVGSGEKGDQRQYQVKRILSVEETQRHEHSCAEAEIRLVDLLLVSCNIALDKWNLERNVAPGVVTSAITVNMQGKYEELQAPNTTSVLFFRALPEERLNVAEFAQKVSSIRKRKLSKQTDMEVRGNLSRMTDALRLLPLPLRKKLVHHVIQKHSFSVSVTMLGVVWPLVENGLPTGNSYLVRIDDTEITEIHGIGYKLLSNTPLILIAYIYLNRLNLVMATSAGLFTREEAELFMDMVMTTLDENSTALATE